MNIHEKWGTIVEFKSPMDFFDYDPDHWRNMLYDRKLIIFKHMRFPVEKYIQFCATFGKPWEKEGYEYSTEDTRDLIVNGHNFVLSPFSNHISKEIGMEEMPWHADVPNHPDVPFPIRTLWITANPNPGSGLTQWINLEQGLLSLPEDLEKQIPDIKILQQSWYNPGTEFQEFDFVKTHPLTGRQSLRLNWYNEPSSRVYNAWIKLIRVDGKDVWEPRRYLQPYIDYLEKVPEVNFEHKWDTFDIAVYDNWTFIHRRTKLEFHETLERFFYRSNLEHLSSERWEEHKLEMKRIF